MIINPGIDTIYTGLESLVIKEYDMKICQGNLNPSTNCQQVASKEIHSNIQQEKYQNENYNGLERVLDIKDFSF